MIQRVPAVAEVGVDRLRPDLVEDRVRIAAHLGERRQPAGVAERGSRTSGSGAATVLTRYRTGDLDPSAHDLVDPLSRITQAVTGSAESPVSAKSKVVRIGSSRMKATAITAMTAPTTPTQNVAAIAIENAS